MTDQKNTEYSGYYEGEFLKHYGIGYIKQICRELRKNKQDLKTSCGKH